MKKNILRIKYKGQILVVLLIALSVLSIFVVVVASNARRDSLQTIQNKQYEQALNAGEEIILKAIAKENLNTNGCSGGPDNYTCNISPESGTLSQDNITVELSIVDSVNEIKNLSLQKDKNLSINLLDATSNSFNDTLSVSWTTDASWQITLDYQSSDGNYRSISDVFDNNDYFSSNPPITHCFNMSAPISNVNSFTINLTSSCQTGPTPYKFLEVRFKPIMLAGTSTLITVTDKDPLTGDVLPPQATVYTVKSYSNSTGSSISESVATANLQAIVPIISSPLEIMDYVLRSQTKISK